MLHCTSSISGLAKFGNLFNNKSCILKAPCKEDRKLLIKMTDGFTLLFWPGQRQALSTEIQSPCHPRQKTIHVTVN
jgi:hypothetical protein